MTNHRSLGNLMRKVLEGKSVAVGAYIDFADPQLVEFCCYLGFDWIFLDGEHDGLSARDCLPLVTAADAVDTPVLVRVASPAAEVILPYAEIGATAILAPHLTDATVARNLVSNLRFPPTGTRGVGGSSRAANYGLTQTPAEYFLDVDRTPVVGGIIEDASALESLSEILAVDGLDIVGVGAGDLAASMGFPGQPQHPDVQDAVRKVAIEANAHGKTVQMAARDVASAEFAIGMGATMLLVPVGALLANAAEGLLSAVREIPKV